MMTRKEAWPELMNEYIRGVRHRKFTWGTFDCCMFAANCVLAMTGIDPVAAYRGKYTDAQSAAVALHEIAGGGLFEVMKCLEREFGWTYIDNPKKVRRGDIVFGNPKVFNPDLVGEGTMGICCGTISIFVGDIELKAVSTIENPGEPPNILHAWRIKTARD